MICSESQGSSVHSVPVGILSFKCNGNVNNFPKYSYELQQKPPFVLLTLKVT